MNQPAAKPPSPEAVKRGRRSSGDDRRRCREGRAVEVDAAARVAEVGVAGVLEERGPRLLAGQCGERRAPRRRRRGRARRTSPMRAGAHQHALAGVAPVDPPDLDRGVVVAAGGDVGLGEAVRRQRALDLLGVDREADGAR